MRFLVSSGDATVGVSFDVVGMLILLVHRDSTR